MYNKSEIMKKAWNLFRDSKLDFMGFCTLKGISFGEALRQVWVMAKATANAIKTIKASVAELHVGDAISIEYGDDGNYVTCTVSELPRMSELGNWYVVHATAENYAKPIEFCMYQGETVTKIAA